MIYSRRNVLCSVCGQHLPKHLLFTTEKREAVERDLADAKRRVSQTRISSDSGSSDVGFLDTDLGGDCGGGD